MTIVIGHGLAPDAPVHAIPRIIHQTWRELEVPAAFRPFQLSWLRHNPAFEYRFWTDEAARRLVAEHYPSLLRLYDSYREPIARVDVARYLWMHRFGGVYADLDFECLRPIDELITGRELVLGFEPQIHLLPQWAARWGIERIVGNAFIASQPGHPFWEHLIGRLEESRDDETVGATGPFFLTRAIAAWNQLHPDGAARVTVVEPELLYPAHKTEVWAAAGETARLSLPTSAFAVHHFWGTWCRPGALAESGARPRQARVPNGPTVAVEPPKVLIATPVKNACRFIDGYVANLRRLRYPHARLSLALLESDSDDSSWEALQARLPALEGDFARVQLFKRDFGFRHSVPRWATAIQRQRRSILARSRNLLLARALTDEEWVLWLDADVVHYPADVIEQLLAAGRDLVVPHCVAGDGRTFDLNTFQLTDEGRTRDWSPWVIDGIVQPPRGEGRLYLEDLVGSGSIVPVDAVGGTMLLVRADAHREGLIFPPFSYKLYIETEGLAMMAADLGYRAWALPDLRITHA